MTTRATRGAVRDTGHRQTEGEEETDRETQRQQEREGEGESDTRDKYREA